MCPPSRSYGRRSDGRVSLPDSAAPSNLGAVALKGSRPSLPRTGGFGEFAR
jgi:hypothetical protein